jgi:hypothetical protein
MIGLVLRILTIISVLRMLFRGGMALVRLVRGSKRQPAPHR